MKMSSKFYLPVFNPVWSESTLMDDKVNEVVVFEDAAEAKAAAHAINCHDELIFMLETLSGFTDEVAAENTILSGRAKRVGLAIDNLLQKAKGAQ